MKTMKKSIAALLVGLMAVLAVTGCSSFDASAYLKALLDNNYKNDSTAFVEQKIGTKEEGADSYQQAIDSEVDSTIQILGVSLDDATKADLEKVYMDIYAALDYTVGDAEKQSDNSYIVKVTYRPMDFYSGLNERFTAAYEEKQQEVAERMQNGETITEEEANKIVVELYIQTLQEQFSERTYGEETTMDIRIELNDNVYSPNVTDYENLGFAMLGAM